MHSFVLFIYCIYYTPHAIQVHSILGKCQIDKKNKTEDQSQISMQILQLFWMSGFSKFNFQTNLNF